MHSDLVSSKTTSSASNCKMCKTDCHVLLQALICRNCNAFVNVCCIEVKEFGNRARLYFCQECRDKNRLIVEFRKRRANERKVDEKKRHYHDIQEIIDHEIALDGSRKFVVRWAGHTSEEDTLEPEEHLDNAIDALNDYCMRQAPPLPLTKVHGIYGASKKKLKLNPLNWVGLSSKVSNC